MDYIIMEFCGQGEQMVRETNTHEFADPDDFRTFLNGSTKWIDSNFILTTIITIILE